MKTHVVIATTEGHAFVQRITEEEPGVQSVMCLDGTAQVLPVSAGYHAFVRRGSGVIARDFGQEAFRIDVGARIDQGNSWQLPVYLAHALQARGELGDGKPQRGDRVLWATGEVDVDLAVRPVAGVAQKLAHAIAPVRALRERGVEVQLLLPTANVGESAGHAEALGGVSGVTRLADVLPKPAEASPAPVAPPAAKPSDGFADAKPASRSWRWALIGLVALVLLLASARYLRPEWFPAEPVNDGRELDDFGGRGRELKELD
ncbi:MAG: hypothetical protein KDJ14_07655 [Xanthomonadales bacterium]|nr:hypothetical protein [Xanthomonadales bacterium]